MADHLSRTTSRASARSRNSSMSRTQSLIKKNIELHDLKPADVLIERFVAWKAIVKQLTAYFEGIADIENNTAKEMNKLAAVIQVPFRAGNQFLGEGGLQDVYFNIRDKTRIIADQHADLGRTIDSSIVQHLLKLRAEIKAHIKNVQNDTGKLAASVAKERETSTKLVGELANSISTFKNTPMNISPRQDPFVANQSVAHQLQRQVLEENLLQKSIVMMQQNSAHFEEGIVRSIQSAWQTFDEWQSRATAASQEIFRNLSAHVAALQPDREWIQFAARSDHLLDPDTPLRDPELINYPLKDDPSTVPVHIGHLGRKKRFTRNWEEAYYVLTPSGFLHEFSSSHPSGQLPTFSLFLPSCTLGPASSPRASSHKFHIEGRKDGLGTTKSGSFKGLLGGEGNKAWSFRARSREEMMEWWNDIRMLCARYLVASEQMERTGPVESAVKSVGYPEEGELDEDEEEGEGSSVEEDQDEGVDVGEYEREHDQAGILPPPVYTHPSVLEVGPNGYPIEKKLPYGQNEHIGSPQLPVDMPGGYQYQQQRTHSASPPFHEHHVQRSPSGGLGQAPITPQHTQNAPFPAAMSGERHLDAPISGSDEDDDEAGVDSGTPGVGRRLSKRAMEKAPETGYDVGDGDEHYEEERHGDVVIPNESFAPATQSTPPPPVGSHTTNGHVVHVGADADEGEEMYTDEDQVPAKQSSPKGNGGGLLSNVAASIGHAFGGGAGGRPASGAQ